MDRIASGRAKGQPRRLEVGVLHGEGEHLLIDLLEHVPALAKLTEKMGLLAVFPQQRLERASRLFHVVRRLDGLRGKGL